MSLNGLDAPDVTAALDAAITEPAGWLILRYASRDTVELLGSGKSGVIEARHALSQYPDKSPLYGMLMFRRKRVLIKCIPEGTSRVLQARTAVHFPNIVERCGPAEATLDITAAEELNDTSLAAVFPLHTGALINSASKLDEIKEGTDDEEDTHAPSPPVQSRSVSATTTLSRKAALERKGMLYKNLPSVPNAPALEASAVDANSATDMHELSILQGNTPTPEERPSTPARSVIHTPASPSERPTPESSSTRSETPKKSQDGSHSNSIDDFDMSSIYPKPKIKLGPRPVAIPDKSKSNPASNQDTKAIAVMPAAIRKKRRSVEIVTKPAIPSDTPAMVSNMYMKPSAAPKYTSQAMSTPPHRILSGLSHASTSVRGKRVLTPEKQRLVKAIEMRRQQQQSRAQSTSSAPTSRPASQRTVSESTQGSGKVDSRSGTDLAVPKSTPRAEQDVAPTLSDQGAGTTDGSSPSKSDTPNTQDHTQGTEESAPDDANAHSQSKTLLALDNQSPLQTTELNKTGGQADLLVMADLSTLDKKPADKLESMSEGPQPDEGASISKADENINNRAVSDTSKQETIPEHKNDVAPAASETVSRSRNDTFLMTSNSSNTSLLARVDDRPLTSTLGEATTQSTPEHKDTNGQSAHRTTPEHQDNMAGFANKSTEETVEVTYPPHEDVQDQQKRSGLDALHLDGSAAGTSFLDETDAVVVTIKEHVIASSAIADASTSPPPVAEIDPTPPSDTNHDSPNELVDPQKSRPSPKRIYKDDSHRKSDSGIELRLDEFAAHFALGRPVSQVAEHVNEGESSESDSPRSLIKRESPTKLMIAQTHADDEQVADGPSHLPSLAISPEETNDITPNDSVEPSGSPTGVPQSLVGSKRDCRSVILDSPDEDDRRTSHSTLGDEVFDTNEAPTVHQATMAISRSPSATYFTRAASTTSIPLVTSKNDLSELPSRRSSSRGPDTPTAIDNNSFDALLLPAGPYDVRSSNLFRPQTVVSPTKDKADLVTSSRRSLVKPGISQRIALLEEKRANQNCNALPPVTSSSPLDVQSSHALSRRSLSLRTNKDTESEGMKERLKSIGTSFARPTSARHSFSSPTRGGHILSQDARRSHMPESPTAVSVIARIVRGEDTPPAVPPKDECYQRSRLVTPDITVKQQRATWTQTLSPQDAQALSLIANDDSVIDSPSPISPAFSQRSVERRRLSTFGRRHRESKIESTDSSPIANSESAEARDTFDDEAEPFRPASRTGRFLKRMSALSTSGSRRKNDKSAPSSPLVTGPNSSDVSPIIPSTNTTSPIITSPADTSEYQAISLGAVNVQFPDSALWKRRTLDIDTSGNLLVTASKSRFEILSTTKKYRLADFDKIYIPDADAQELAHSVWLELRAGTLQCACQDAAAQRETLRVLTRYHEFWTAHGASAE